MRSFYEPGTLLSQNGVQGALTLMQALHRWGSYSEDSAARAGITYYPTNSRQVRTLVQRSRRRWGVNTFHSLMFSETDSDSDKVKILKILLDAEQPPIALLDSDRKRVFENWYVPVPGPIKHVVNVIGYGFDRNPLTLAQTPYFLVRDSLVHKLTHYKVPALEFVRHLLGVMKITEPRVFRVR